MSSLNERAAKQLGYVAITALVFIGLNWINELFFLRFEQAIDVNWVFLPAGIRLLATLLFGFAGFVGLLLVSLYLNFFHFAFPDNVSALSGAVAAALGPYLAYLFAKHWFDLGPRLAGLTVQRLLFMGVLCGVMNPAFHHAFTWVHTGEVDWLALTAMIVGDITGILIVLYAAKGAIGLARRHGRAGLAP